MVLGVDIPGLDKIFGNFNVQEFLQGTFQIIILIIIFAFIAGLIIAFLWAKNQKKLYNKKIYWFEEVNGQLVPIGMDLARELTIPNSNVNVFYIKKPRDIYLPRGTKRMGKDTYWYCVKNNREIVNFTLKNLNLEMAEAGLDYDHTDMRYALTNLKDLIKRNYRDKSQPWWRVYKDAIIMVMYIFIFTLAFYFLITKIGGLVDKIGSLITVISNLPIAQTSGVTQVI